MKRISTQTRSTSTAAAHSHPAAYGFARGALGGLLAVAAFGAGACRHVGTADITTLAAGSDRALWESASKALQKRQYAPARQYLTRLIENFPSSPHQPLARLSRADSYFQEGGAENYTLAATDYREFTSLYPSHPRVEYAQLQLAECYFKQRLPPDRDQTNTTKALEEYERFLNMFPASPLFAQARDRANTCRWALAQAEYAVGFFYQRTRQDCRAAVQRYQALLTGYPDYPGTDEVLFHLAECLVRARRANEAAPVLARLLDNYPNSHYRERAQRLRPQANITPTPTASPTPAAPPQ
jgi:outer membrane protein assembly factor BamD